MTRIISQKALIEDSGITVRPIQRYWPRLRIVTPILISGSSNRPAEMFVHKNDFDS
jgi:hypothetical protein